MAHVKNVGGGPSGDDGDRPRPPPSAQEKGKQKVITSKKHKADKEAERAERVARMLDRVERGEIIGGLHIGDTQSLHPV